jgi:hypothetical protein
MKDVEALYGYELEYIRALQKEGITPTELKDNVGMYEKGWNDSTNFAIQTFNETVKNFNEED